MMFACELRLPDQLLYGADAERPITGEAYTMELRNRLEKVHEALRSNRFEIRSQDSETTDQHSRKVTTSMCLW